MISPIEVIINAGSGASDKIEISRRLAELFKAAGLEARLALAHSGAEIVELARRAALSDAAAVVAGGGDGTINAVAGELIGTEKALGVLPLGTFNYFARNLNIPLDPEAAARNIIEGRIVRADIGELNGQVFLNNASLGLYPRILRQREQEYLRWGRSKLAAYYSALRALLHPIRVLNLRLYTEAGSAFRRTPLVFVCSNDYQLREFNVPGAACVAAGKLAFYIARPVGRLGMIRMAILTFLQRLDTERDLEVLCLEAALISSRRRLVNVAIDGEVKVMTTPLRVSFRRGALPVIAPAP